MAVTQAFVWTHYPATLSGIERFCRKYQMAESTFGRKAANDPNLIRAIRNGRTIGVRLEVRIEEFMKEWQRP